MSDRQEQNSGTREVREAHRFDVEMLEGYMASHVESFRGPLAYAPIFVTVRFACSGVIVAPSRLSTPRPR